MMIKRMYQELRAGMVLDLAVEEALIPGCLDPPVFLVAGVVVDTEVIPARIMPVTTVVMASVGLNIMIPRRNRREIPAYYFALM